MRYSLTLCCMSAAMLFMPRMVSAQCTNTTPNGPWGFIIQGSSNTSSSSPAPTPLFRARPAGNYYNSGGSTTNPFAITGVIVFNGTGGLTGTVTVNFGGGVISSEPVNGTYSVNPNCTFSMNIFGLPVFSYNGVFVNGVTEFLIVNTNSGFTATGSGNKIGGGTCTNATATGSWGFTAQGFTESSSPSMGMGGGIEFAGKKTPGYNSGTTNTPLGFTGILVFNGAGALTGTVTFSDNGGIGASQFVSGTYTVNPNCTFTVHIFGLPAFSFTGVLVNGGTQFIVVNTDTGISAIGTGYKQ
jgi:hypothetical protein